VPGLTENDYLGRACGSACWSVSSSRLWRWCCSGCGFEGDGEAEGLELPDVIAHLAPGVEAAGVVGGALSLTRNEQVSACTAPEPVLPQGEPLAACADLTGGVLASRLIMACAHRMPESNDTTTFVYLLSR
jgi:hypothetical protein